EPGVLQPEDAEAQGRVEHVGFDAVDLVVLQPLRWIPAAGPRVAVRALGQELGQLLRALARREPDPDRMRRVALIEAVGTLRAARSRSRLSTRSTQSSVGSLTWESAEISL